MITLNGGWDEFLKDEFQSENYLNLREFLKTEYFSREIYPPMNDIYNCFKLTPLNELKVVILGQDPYHEPNQAHGLCFSVQDGIKLPPSLQNIFKELHSDLGLPVYKTGDLTKWAKEGVLLLNTTLTVRRGQAASHYGRGWETFTDGVIKKISDELRNIVFILWGSNARSKKKFINPNKHFIIESAHPSPLSAYNGFFGSKPFSKTNEYLKSKNIKEIDWSL